MNKRVVILLIGNSVEMYSILYPAFTFGIERTAADKSTSHVTFMVMVVIFSPEQDPYHRYDSSTVNSCVPRDVDNHDNSKLSLASSKIINHSKLRCLPTCVILLMKKGQQTRDTSLSLDMLASSLSSVSLSSHEYLVQFESFLMPFKVTVKVLHLLLLSNAELQKVWNCLSFFLYNFCYCTEMLKNGDRSPMGLWVFLHGQQNLEALLFARSNPL